MKRAMIAVSIFLSLLTVAIGIGAGAASTEGGADFARSSAAAPGIATSVFYEGFEVIFPGANWYVGDEESNSGADYWGEVGINYGFRAYAGNWSGWCASVGLNSEYGGLYNEDVHAYDDDMEAYMIKVDPVDMSAWDLAYLDFYAWSQTESGPDFVMPAWITGTGWVKDATEKITGTSDWTRHYWKMPYVCMTNDARFGFVFRSDLSVVGEGVYLDEINLMRADVTVESDSYADAAYARPGDTFTIHYHIHNPAPFSVQCGLDVQMDNGALVFDDTAHDTVVTIPPGYSWQTRTFTVDSGAPDDLYDLEVVIWSGMPQDFTNGNRMWGGYTIGALTVGTCGTMGVSPSSCDLAVTCGQTSSQVFDMSAYDADIQGVSVARTSGPTWLTVNPSSLGTISPGPPQTFTMTAAPPAATLGAFPYKVTVSNACGWPPSVDLTGTITVSCDPEAVVYPSMQNVTQGGTFSVDILVDPSGRGVSGGEVSISFDPSAMSANDIVYGNLLGTSPMVGSKQIDNTLGTIHYALGRQGTTYPPTPLGKFATVTFMAKSKLGIYPIEMTSIVLADEASQDIPGIITLDGQVTVVEQVTAPPTVSTSIATSVGTTSATLNGNLSSLGTASTVQVSFEWGLTNGYGTTTTPQTRTGTGVFDSPLSGLTPGATYHFRARAVGDGTAYGDDMTFTTNIVPNQQPNLPSNTAPTAGATGVSLTPTLSASAFADPDAGDTHAASQWQMITSPWDYQSPAFDSGTDNTNLTSISVPSGVLTISTLYYWRVRYQDNHGAWSEWSTETRFDTTPVANQPPAQPAGMSPATKSNGVSLTPALQASAFSDPNSGDTHGASQWQIDDDPWDYVSPAFDSGTDNTNLTSISVPSGKLTYSTRYFWRVRYQDNHGAWSDWSEEMRFDTMSTSADSIPPTMPSVADDGVSTTSTTSLHASWSSSDPESGIADYSYAVGTTAGGNDVLDWTSAGTATEETITGLSLTVGQTYYVSVKAQNGHGLWSEVGSSDGITVSAEETETAGDNGAPFWVWILVALGVVGAGAGGFVLWWSRMAKPK